MSIKENYQEIKKTIPESVLLLAVSKTKPKENIEELYQIGVRDFAENKVQELCAKYEALPKDIKWHFIGHLQTNKIKYMIDFVHLIHSVDSVKLLLELDKQAQKHNRIINCLLQPKIALEDSKTGFSIDEIHNLIKEDFFSKLKNINICGLMGMGTNTEDENEIKKEFTSVKKLFDELQNGYFRENHFFNILSMGMSEDYKIAIEQGSSLVRIGSTIFGARDYSKQQ